MIGIEFIDYYLFIALITRAEHISLLPLFVAKLGIII